jgi:hypothetical protein
MGSLSIGTETTRGGGSGVSSGGLGWALAWAFAQPAAAISGATSTNMRTRAFTLLL